MEPAVKSSPHSGHGMRCHRRSRYVAPSPVILPEILLWNPCVNTNSPQLEGHGIGFFYIIHQAEYSEESNENIDGHLDPFWVPSSNHATIRIKKNMQLPTTTPSPSWVEELSSTMGDSQWRTTLYTDTLKSVGKSSPPSVISMVSRNWGLWKPFWWVTNSCIDQNSTSNTLSFSPDPYPTKVCSSLPWYRLLCALLRSSNNKSSGYWSTLDNSWASFSPLLRSPPPSLRETYARHHVIELLY